MYHIHDLPDSLLLDILRDVSVKTILYSARYVCLKWHELCRDNYVWKNRDLSPKQGMRLQHFVDLAEFDADLSTVRSVDYVCCPDAHKLPMEKLLRSTRSLEILRVQKTICSSYLQEFSTVLENNRDLRVLSCSLGRWRWPDFTETVILDLLQKCPEVEEFCFGWKLNDATVAKIVAICRRLKKLNLCACSDLSDNTLKLIAELPHLQELLMTMFGEGDFLSIDVLAFISEKLPHLTKFTYCNFFRYTPGDTTKLAALSRLHQLQSLYLMRCKLDHDTMQVISEGCPAIELLLLEKCHWITDSDVYHITTNLTMLKRLSLHGARITDVALAYIGDNCKLLRVLRLHRVYTISEQGIYCVVSKLSRRELIVVGYSVRYANPPNRFPVTLAQKFPRIMFYAN